MSSITILAAGAKANAGTSTPVDVSGFSTLRLDATMVANLGKGPEMDVYIETSAASADRPWFVVWHSRQNAATWEGSKRVVLSPDSFLRVRWAAFATKNCGMFNGELQNSVELNLSIVGDGKPDA